MKNKTIKEPEDINLHIRKRSAKYFLLSILMLGLNILNFLFLKYLWTFLELGNLKREISYQPIDLLIIYPIIQQYILLSLLIICIFSIFNKLKNYKEEELIYGIIVGLLVGFLYGLLVGFLYGLILGLIYGIIAGLIYGIIHVLSNN